MALPKIEEVRQLSDEELAEEIIATKRKLFDLRFQQATRQLESTHEFKHTRHRMAQLLTIERERQLNINQSSSTSAEEA
ncbi:50S ribosomal protein L29 [Cyanothece sp. BG0011]|uniref:50S ribosomal protein L29 n=1 Tax=Cyanothece sp. BG0011 TaxID=2082950 RepID=UPI000D1F3F20|nr:50S ribosomal protein L29 [Cyanothece sp. BG0011]